MAAIGRDLKITWYGHATFLFETPGGKRIMIDPWTSGNPACPDHLKQVSNLDILLITHGHFDHVNDVIEVVRSARPGSVVGILEMANWLGRKGIENVTGMNKGGTVEIDGIRITMLHADHSCGIEEEDGSIIYGGEAVGYLIQFENGLKLYHSGDTALFGDLSLYGEFFSPDVAILPIGDHFTMDPRQAARAARMLRVEYAIPSHYGTFPVLTGTPDMFREELAKLGAGCQVLETQPGGTIE